LGISFFISPSGKAVLFFQLLLAERKSCAFPAVSPLTLGGCAAQPNGGIAANEFIKAPRKSIALPLGKSE